MSFIQFYRNRRQFRKDKKRFIRKTVIRYGWAYLMRSFQSDPRVSTARAIAYRVRFAAQARKILKQGRKGSSL